MKRTNLLFTLVMVGIFFASALFAQNPMMNDTSKVVVYGCMNPKAKNFNPKATKDNGTCEFYKDSMTMPPPPMPPVIFGCMNPRAINYNKFANRPNESCVFDSIPNHPLDSDQIHHMDSIAKLMIYGCMDSTALNYNPKAKISNHNCIYKRVIPGCTDSLALNFNPKANVNDGNCRYEKKIWGCTDSTALNYNPKATHDNGYCVYVKEIKGCTDKTAINYNPMANKDNRTCIFLSNDSISGCTDPYALNFNKHAKKDNGKCKYEQVTDTLRGCMDSTALNFDPTATIKVRCIYTSTATTEILGCKSPRALNFNHNAIKEDGSCIFAHPVNMMLPKVITPEMTAIADTLGKVLQASCNFNFIVPIDTVYIVKMKPVANKDFEVEWAIVQGSVTTDIKTVFTLGKKGTSLLYLSLVCNQAVDTTTTTSAAGVVRYKVSSSVVTASLVKGVTVSSYINNVMSGVITATTNDNGITLYPNPVRDQLNVTYVNSSNNNLQLNIYSVDGRKLISTNVTSISGTNNFQINTTGLKAGLHFMTINRNGAVIETVKFAKY
jgi:hypothetical protein